MTGFASTAYTNCVTKNVLEGSIHQVLTNFHLPRSTLLAMIMALAGIDLTRKAYAHAAAARYRFYSYGDAMLIV